MWLLLVYISCCQGNKGVIKVIQFLNYSITYTHYNYIAMLQANLELYFSVHVSAISSMLLYVRSAGNLGERLLSFTNCFKTSYPWSSAHFSYDGRKASDALASIRDRYILQANRTVALTKQ